MEKFGIEETKDVLVFGFDLKDFLADAKADGKINFKDAFKMPKVFTSGLRAFGGIDQVRNELLDLSENEKEELYQIARERYQNANQSIEELVEDTISEVLDLANLGLRWHEATRKEAA